MANRGIYGSLSSIPVEMGDCGTAFVDVSPEFPNLCFQIPLIATGGAKPLSLSLLYNERAAAGMPFANANIARAVANAAINYNNAYSAYVVAKATSRALYLGFSAAYFVAENYMSYWLGQYF